MPSQTTVLVNRLSKEYVGADTGTLMHFPRKTKLGQKLTWCSIASKRKRKRGKKSCTQGSSTFPSRIRRRPSKTFIRFHLEKNDVSPHKETHICSKKLTWETPTTACISKITPSVSSTAASRNRLATSNPSQPCPIKCV